MRFITEFEVPETFHGDPAYFPKHTERFVNNSEESLRYEMGKMLQEMFGWKNPVNGNPRHHRLEIEAFPMDKWIEFKKRVLNHLLRSKTTMKLCAEVEQMFKELESFGKPVGEAK